MAETAPREVTTVTVPPATPEAAPLPLSVPADQAPIEVAPAIQRREPAEDVARVASEVREGPKETTNNPTTVAPETPSANEDDLPDNEYSEQYRAKKAEFEAGNEGTNPMQALYLAFLLMAAKYSHLAYVLMPGSYQNEIWESDKYKNMVLEGEGDQDQKSKVLAPNPTRTAEQIAEDFANEARNQGRLGKEKASTRFVANVLWGITDIYDAATLCAKLVHTKRFASDGKDVNLYRFGPSFDVFKANPIKKGTLIVFMPEPMKGEKVVAYATDGEGNFEYYNVGRGKTEKDVTGIIKFNIKDKDCPVKMMGLLTIMVPNLEKFAVAKEAAPTVEKTVLETIEAENALVARMIEDYESNKSEENLQTLKTAARDNFNLAEKEYQRLEAEAKSAQDNDVANAAMKNAKKLLDVATKNRDAAEKLRHP